VVSSPKGAIAMLDGQADTACTTPCTLEASPGPHKVEITKTGYDVERRDVRVDSSPVEIPAVVMHSLEGTLMVTSVPAGATVLVDGKRQQHPTPAQISLPPGSYSITVEWKDGNKETHTVEIKDKIVYEKFLVAK